MSWNYRSDYVCCITECLVKNLEILPSENFHCFACLLFFFFLGITINNFLYSSAHNDNTMFSLHIILILHFQEQVTR